MTNFFYIAFLFLALPCFALKDAQFSYISNTEIKLGVITNYGAIIGYFSKTSSGKSMVNSFDSGREIQQSFYGNSDGSHWPGSPNSDWRWNPVQGGSWENDKPVLLEFKNTGKSIYAKTHPRNWAGKQLLTNVIMEEWIKLDEDVAKISYKFSYTGTNNHPETHQELPAVFIDADYDTFVYYNGKKPWTGGALTNRFPSFPNESANCPENWAAYVKDGYGLGVYFPDSEHVTLYRYVEPNQPPEVSCSYFAPLRTMAVTPNLEFKYDVYLTIGETEKIRERFYKIHSESESFWDKIMKFFSHR